MIQVSAVIPCYNKVKVLPQTLRALQAQTIGPDGFDVVVVDDGSTDGTKQFLANCASSYSFRYILQENAGAGAARNAGALACDGRILLFLDADIVLRPDAIAAHLDAHDKYHSALIAGRIVPVTPNPVGIEDLLFQKIFDFGVQERHLPWNCTITQCLSIAREDFARVGLFDEDLRRGQDIAYGYRAVQCGLDIIHYPTCVGEHNHAQNLIQHCQVERSNSRHLVAFFVRYPHLKQEFPYLADKWPVAWASDPLPLIVRKLIRRLGATWPALLILWSVWSRVSRMDVSAESLEATYWKLVASYQLLGIREGIAAYTAVRSFAEVPDGESK